MCKACIQETIRDNEAQKLGMQIPSGFMASAASVRDLG
jgi:hypothetical protein